MSYDQPDPPDLKDYNIVAAQAEEEIAREPAEPAVPAVLTADEAQKLVTRIVLKALEDVAVSLLMENEQLAPKTDEASRTMHGNNALLLLTIRSTAMPLTKLLKQMDRPRILRPGHANLNRKLKLVPR